MFKRQFLDYLYEFSNPNKKVFNIKSPGKSYYQLFSPSQLLEEINNQTDLGILILKGLEENKKNLINMKLSSDEDEIQSLLNGVLDNAAFQENQEGHI